MPVFDRRIKTFVSIYWFPFLFSYEFEFVMSLRILLTYIEDSNRYIMDTIVVFSYFAITPASQIVI